ncbi:uncharacterized protein VTP21DRAFT_9694 [Calcarisporiella thermophila]|uniref:uncharacterized protein n=1 Tax=Calcarisporiella thermophila TaxID=911321 RepID=UPI003741F3C9
MVNNPPIKDVSKIQQAHANIDARIESAKKAHAERQRKYYREAMNDPEKANELRERKRKSSREYYQRKKRRLEMSLLKEQPMTSEDTEKEKPESMVSTLSYEEVNERNESVLGTVIEAPEFEDVNVMVDRPAITPIHVCEQAFSSKELSPSGPIYIDVDNHNNSSEFIASDDHIEINANEVAKPLQSEYISPHAETVGSSCIPPAPSESPNSLTESSPSCSSLTNRPISPPCHALSPEPSIASRRKSKVSEIGKSESNVFLYKPPQWAALKHIDLLNEPHWLNDEIIDYFLQILKEYLDAAMLASDLYIGLSTLRQFLPLGSRSSRQSSSIRPNGKNLDFPPRYERAVFLNNNNQHWNVYSFDRATKSGRCYCTVFEMADDQDYALYANFLKEGLGWRVGRGWSHNSATEPCIKQTNNFDCGPLACMILVALATGLDPAKIILPAGVFREFMRKAILAGKISSLPALVESEPEVFTLVEWVKMLDGTDLYFDPPRHFTPSEIARQRRGEFRNNIVRVVIPQIEFNKDNVIYWDPSDESEVSDASEASNESEEYRESEEYEESSESEEIVGPEEYDKFEVFKEYYESEGDKGSEESEEKEEPVVPRLLPTPNCPTNRYAMFSTLDDKVLMDSILNTGSMASVDQDGLDKTCVDNEANYTLETFLSKLESSSENSMDRLIQWVVCGKDDQGKKIRLTFDDHFGFDEREIGIAVDIDSFLWTGDVIPVKEEIKIFPFPNRSATLTTHNHLYVQIPDSEGGEVRLSQIPNFELAHFGPMGNFRLLILFPRLRKRSEKGRWINFVTSKDMARFYDELLLPSILAVTTVDAHCHFPLSYDLTMKNSMTRKGEFKYPGFVLHSSFIPRVVEEMRKRVETTRSLEDFRDFFFHIYAKNLKLATKSSYSDTMSYVQEKCPSLDFEQMSSDAIMVDLGVEWYFQDKRSGARTLLWRATFLDELFQQCKATALPRRDSWNHCSTLGGKAAEWPMRIRKAIHCAFIQAYHLEKEVLYSCTKGSKAGVLKFDPDDALFYNKRYQDSVSAMKTAWTSAKNESFGVRLEMRMSLSAFRKVFDVVQERARSFVSKRAFAAVPTSLVSQFKLAKLKAYDEILRRQSLTAIKDRVEVQSVNLTGIIVWLIKSIISRPDDYGSFLRQPHFVEALNGMVKFNLGAIPSFIPQNLFLSFEFDEGRFAKVHGFRRTVNLRKRVQNQPHAIQASSSRNPHTPTDRLQPEDYITRNPDAYETDESDTDIELPCNEDQLKGAHGLERTMRQMARQIFREFKKDLWSLFPNPAVHLSNPLYQELERVNFTIDEIKRYVRNPYFMFSVRVNLGGSKVGHPAGLSWGKRFEMYFNTSKELRGKYMQGWDRLQYLRLYRQTCLNLAAEDMKKLDDCLLARFMRMETLPNSQPKGKVWQTRSHPKDSLKMRGSKETWVHFVLNETLAKK